MKGIVPSGFVRFVVLLALVFTCAGCSDLPIAQDINQTQANEIVAVLNESGVRARAIKETGGRGRYRVEVGRDDYAFSIGLLNQRGLPGKTRASFEELVAQRGLIPDSREIELLRVEHALGVQVAEALENHPAIISSKVIVRNGAREQGGRPAVSAIIRTRPGADANEQELREIITRSVPGSQPPDVFISVHPDQSLGGPGTLGGVYRDENKVVRVPLVPFLFSWHVPEGEYHSLALILVTLFVAIGIVGGLIGYWFGYFQNSKQVFESDLPHLGGSPASALKLDGEKRSLPEV